MKQGLCAVAGVVLVSAMGGVLSGVLYAQQTSVPAVASTPKKPLSGLLSMGRLNFLQSANIKPDPPLSDAQAHPDIYVGAVLTALWRQLEPERGKVDSAIIDHALADARAYNAHHKQPIAIKLRIFGGVNAPEWAKSLGGGQIQVDLGKGSVTLGHFWTEAYNNEMREMQRQLAARYDNEPLLAEVAISSCSSATAEPFIFPHDSKSLRAAGLTDDAMKACLERAPQDYAAWKNTPIDYTFNPFNLEQAGLQPDTDFTIQLMRKFRAALGERAVIANHGLKDPPKPVAIPIYAELKRLGGPLEFQMLAPNEDMDSAVRVGVMEGATEIELWPSREAGGASSYTQAELLRWSAAVKANSLAH